MIESRLRKINDLFDYRADSGADRDVGDAGPDGTLFGFERSDQLVLRGDGSDFWAMVSFFAATAALRASVSATHSQVYSLEQRI